MLKMLLKYIKFYFRKKFVGIIGIGTGRGISIRKLVEKTGNIKNVKFLKKNFELTKSICDTKKIIKYN